MPVAVYRSPGVVEVEERPVPTPGPDQVLVEVDHCGICGSDIHLLFDGWGPPGLVAGHEFSGRIAAVGNGVKGWAPGDPIVAGTSPRCGHCRRCLEGKPSQCENREGSIMEGSDGAFARYTLVGAASLLERPEGMDSRAAALAEPLAVALHGITRSGVSAGDSVMIFGAGPIGALSLAVLAGRGIGPITVIEPSARRRQLAADLGADEVLAPGDLDEPPKHEPERIAERAVHVVLECSGRSAAMEAGFAQLRRGGTMALVGAGRDAPTFQQSRFILNELNICGSFIYDLGGFEDSLKLLSETDFPTELLLEPDDVSLEGISGALAGLAAGDLAGKVLVSPGGNR